MPTHDLVGLIVNRNTAAALLWVCPFLIRAATLAVVWVSDEHGWGGRL